jgi:hypothetical protein
VNKRRRYRAKARRAVRTRIARLNGMSPMKYFRLLLKGYFQ